MQRNVPQHKPEANQRQTNGNGMIKQKCSNGAEQKYKRITTKTWKQITKNSVKTHPKNAMQKKAQNKLKTAGCEPDGRNGAKIRKRGLFHSPIFHITCIIRNLYNQKIRPSALSPRLRSEKFGGSMTLFRRVRCRAIPAAVLSQNMHRPLRSMRGLSVCSRPRCQTVQRRLRWSRSTVLPERQDNSHLPES